MNWTAPKHGELRERKTFAWLPVVSEDGRTRWLETVWVVEKYRIDYGFGYWLTLKFKEVQ